RGPKSEVPFLSAKAAGSGPGSGRPGSHDPGTKDSREGLPVPPEQHDEPRAIRMTADCTPAAVSDGTIGSATTARARSPESAVMTAAAISDRVRRLDKLSLGVAREIEKIAKTDIYFYRTAGLPRRAARAVGRT